MVENLLILTNSRVEKSGYLCGLIIRKRGFKSHPCH